MRRSIEVRYSRALIDKAETRLAYQRAFVRRLGSDADPRFAAIANETLVLMEARLSRLRESHQSLLEAQQRDVGVRRDPNGADATF